MTTDEVEVTSADIARIAGVKPTAVSNWRRRHDDFPKPVGGTDRSPRFALAQVEEWLKRQGRVIGVAPQERLWQAFDSVGGAIPPEDAVAMVGMLLLHLGEYPDTVVPTDEAGWSNLMTRAEHTFVSGGAVGAGVADLVAHLPPVDSARLSTLLTVAVDIATAGADRNGGDIFESLSTRFLDSPSRSGLATTPQELAALMVELTGPPSGSFVDLACGGGTLLLAAVAYGYHRVQGQELNASVARIAALRLAFRSSRDTPVTFDIRADDSLRRPAYPRARARAVVSNPPFAERNWGYEELMHDPDWEYGIPPRMESDLAWVQRTLAQVAPGGTIVLLMPPGAAFRPSGRRIRRELLTRSALRAVISLPPGLAAHYSLALQIWILCRPNDSSTPTPLLVVDTTGRESATRTDAAATWAQIRETVIQAWSGFMADPDGYPGHAGIARAVPLPELLDEDVDVTPRRHLPLAPQQGVSDDELAAAREQFLRLLNALGPTPPDSAALPEIDPRDVRPVALGELTKTGAVFIRRALSNPSTQGGDETPPATRVGGRILNAADIVAGRPATTVGDVDGDEVRNPPIRRGDVLVPVVARHLAARVASDDDTGAYPSSSVYVLRIDPTILDPWFLAGYLSSSDGSRQAERMGTSLVGDIRVDLRRVRVPLIPIDIQRAYGEAFRKLSEFTRTLRNAHDLGLELARNSTNAIAAELVVGADRLPAAL
ncbi:SAM-dependent methyltransferase [Actinoplanes sp. ATCC 53533]|uniref:N-6 DNA methylase n=1 Tax=Actinoplanes sp. ATCC 53533 TaxID=1288362 RepID=UPI000F7B9CD2|nr:N-6 DNA methylase [Actinoplanes sp. ATCC 53533]RSM46761.1 SAM-dependent methyltransferase [Actinoplanes sp. ATCC 53533]